VRVEPDSENGLKAVSWVMTEKIITLSVDKLHQRIGSLSTAQMKEVSKKLAAVLGLSAS